jgi:hypothetical protein
MRYELTTPEVGLSIISIMAGILCICLMLIAIWKNLEWQKQNIIKQQKLQSQSGKSSKNS